MPGTKAADNIKFEDLDIEQIRALAEYGHTDDFMADFFGVTASKWQYWKKSHPQFFQKLKGWKAVADDRVERALYERALGYEWEEDAIVWDRYQRERVQVRLEKRLPPDTTACIFWLKNRRKAEWREKIEVAQQHTGEIKHNLEGEIKLQQSYDLDERVRLVAEMAAENRVNQIEFGKDLKRDMNKELANALQ